MKTVLWILLCGVSGWCGMVFGIESRPPAVVYVTKQDTSVRCELWEKFKKKEAKHL